MKITVPKRVDWSALNEAGRQNALRRPPMPAGDFRAEVAAIIASVEKDGDNALRALGEKYDAVVLDDLRVSAEEWARADSMVEPGVLQAMEEAISRIDAFHVAGKPAPVSLETATGLRCEARYLPISPVGLYVPGGSAPLISTVIMLAVPARIAGCEEHRLLPPWDSVPKVFRLARSCMVRAMPG